VVTFHGGYNVLQLKIKLAVATPGEQH
jgi:hypothetical protein